MPPTTTATDPLETTVPADGFTSPRYHFGMLLGVEDFDCHLAYHRGKMRLHNAWLHGAGVVWGLGVDADLEHGELRVAPGFALDAAGHELALDSEACVNVGAWYAKHREDPDFEGGLEFKARVVARLKACLARQVPALAEPCADATSDTAYSRTVETVELRLLPGWAEEVPRPYHRLRVLFGLEDARADDAGDQQVVDALAALDGASGTELARGYLRALRRFAALDEIDLAPADPGPDAPPTRYPAAEDADVLLAHVMLTVQQQESGWTLKAADVDPTVRPSHIATSTIQELLCGPAGGAAPGVAPAPGPAPGLADDQPSAAAGGVDVEAVDLAAGGKSVALRFTGPLDDGSAQPAAFAATVLEPTGWRSIPISKVAYRKGTRKATLTLDEPLLTPWRLVAFGTGPTPLLGADLLPLAGGHDHVHMQTH